MKPDPKVTHLSARMVTTRYQADVFGMAFPTSASYPPVSVRAEVYLCVEVDPILTALADKETEIATLTRSKANAESCTDTVWDDLQTCMSQRDKARNEVDALTTRAKVTEARIVQLNVIVQAAEATISRVEEEFQRHKDLSFKLFADAVDRADKFEAITNSLREGVEIAIDALDNYSNVNDGEDGPVPNQAMSAITQLNGFIKSIE